jgi:hypothetical protein
MATFMDISLMSTLAPIFMFLLVFAITFGLLSISRLLKSVPGEKALYAIIAFVISIFLIVSADLMKLLSVLTPWFAALIVFIFLIFIVLKMFVGGDSESFFKDLLVSKDNPAVKWVLVVIIVLLFLIALSSTYGQKLTDQDPTTPNSQVGVVSEPTSYQDELYISAPAQSYYSTTSVSSQTQTTGTGDFSSNLLQTIVHPKILGLLLFALICFFSILLLAKSNN